MQTAGKEEIWAANLVIVSTRSIVNVKTEQPEITRVIKTPGCTPTGGKRGSSDGGRSGGSLELKIHYKDGQLMKMILKQIQILMDPI